MALCFLSINAIQAQPTFVTDSLNTYIKNAMQQWQIPGMAVAIIKDGKVVLANGYGVANVETKKPVDAYTLFQIASNSKAFTGTAIAWLDYEKQLGLDSTVTTYLKDFKLYDKSSTQLCTVRDLLCHRLGYSTFQGDFLHWGSSLSRKQLMDNWATLKPQYPFRYTYGYCNMGFVAAGEVIKAVTDTSWENFLEHRFFKPMQLKHTHTSFKNLTTDVNACTPYTLISGKLTELPFTSIESIGPCASINSCVADMAQWLLLQLDSGRLNGRQIIPWPVIRETQLSAMVEGDIHSKLFPAKHFNTYGLGWAMYDYNGVKVIEHGGGANGFVTKTKFIPELNLGILVYTNTDANSLYEALATQIIDAYMHLPYRNYSDIYYKRYANATAGDDAQLADYKKRVDAMAKPTLPLEAYTGTYYNSFYGKASISYQKGKMMLKLQHHPNNIGVLQYMDNNTFLCTYSDVTCGVMPTPFSVNDGKVTSVKIKVNDFIDYDTYEFIKQ